MKRLIFTIFAMLISMTTFSQISGIVIDSTNNKPLQGCSVVIMELNKGQITDRNGKFYFKKIPQGELTLQVNFLGYKTYIKKLTYTHKPIFLKIYLTPQAVKAEQVVVTGFLPGAQHNSALKIDAINTTDVSGFEIPNILTALQAIPGVEIYSKGIGIGMPVIRGLSKTNIVVLNNGFRLEDFQFSENHPFFIDQFGTSKLEVIKGTTSLLYGSDAIGGVINAIWEKPAPVNKTYQDFALQYHSNTRGIVSSAGIKHSTPDYSWGIRMGYNSNADLRDGTGEQVTNTRFLRQTAKAFFFIYKNKLSSKFYTQISRDKLGLCVTPAFPLVKDDYRFPEYFYQDLFHFFLGNKNVLFINKNNKLNFNISTEFNRRGLRVYPDQPKTIDMGLTNFTYDLRLTSQKNTVTTIIGSQGLFTYNLNYGQHIFLPNYQKLNSSIYSLLQWQIKNSSKILGGLRYDFTSMHFYSPDYSPDQFPDTTLAFGNVSASIGNITDITSWLLLRINLATGYRTPNPAELGENGIHAFRYEKGDLNLKPQRSYEADLNLHLHKTNYVLDLSAYYNNIKNYIYLNPTFDTASNGMRIYQYCQTNAIIYGLETGGEYSFENLDIRLIYNYIKSADQNHNSLPFIPQNKLKAFITYKFSSSNNKPKIVLSLNPIYAFAYKNPAPTELPSDSYLLINTGLDLQLKSKQKIYMVGLKIFNLLNTVYSDHLSSLKEAGFYDMGRNIMLSCRIKFL